MDNNEYKKTLSEIRTTLTETTKPIDYIDTSKMSKKERDNLIIELQNKIHSLQSQLLIRKSVDERYINGLIQSKYDETMNLIHNPVVTLPSGTQIQFSSLSSEQLEYLESLAVKQKIIVLKSAFV